MRLSIVVATHNEGDVLVKTLKSVYETTGGLEFEVIVADDGSTDGSVDTVRSQFPHVRIVSLASRGGPASSKDAGARAAQGDTILFLDAHTKPERGAIRTLLEQVEALDGQAIVYPTIPALDVSRWRNSRQQLGQGYALDLRSFACSWKPTKELRRSQLGRTELYESPALIGCAFALSQELYETLWGQDVGMLEWGVEDIDLGMKSWLMGHPVLLAPSAIIGHRFRATFDNYAVNSAQMLANQLRMARKTFTETVWNEWVQMAQPRFQQSSRDVPEGVWTRAWTLFEKGRASVEEERSYLHGRRIRDEFWYAEYFGLDWPTLNATRKGNPPKPPAAAEGVRAGDGSRSLGGHGARLSQPQAGAPQFLSFVDPSPSPSPEPTPPITPPPCPACDNECDCDQDGPGPGSGGTQAASTDPINYLNGQIVLSVTDLSSNSFSTLWKHTRTYSNQLASASADVGQGYNWLVNNWPQMVRNLVSPSVFEYTVVRGTAGSLWFASDLSGKFGAQSSLSHDSENQLFVLTSPNGTQQEFHDFDQTTYPAGSFARQIEPGGLVTSVESYTEDGLISEIHRVGTIDGQTFTEAFVYTYTDDVQIETLTLRRQLGSSGWEDVRRVAYSYWGDESTFGSLGDLQQVTIQVHRGFMRAGLRNVEMPV